jgi:DNA-binding sugar fermentation-stimulating protein
VMAPAGRIDPAYAQELARAAEAGVKIVVLTTEVEPPRITLAGTLPVRW